MEVYKYNLPFHLTPERTALLVIDMQNDFCHPEGIFALNGFVLKTAPEIIQPLRRVIEICKKAKIPTIYTRHIIRCDSNENAVDGGIWVEMRPFLKREGLRPNTWGSSEIEEIARLTSDYIIEKPRFSAFYQTNLEVLLRGLRVESLIFTGIVTNICVESSLRDAFFRDFKVVAIRDCMTAYKPEVHEASLRNMAFFGTVITFNELEGSL